MEVGGAFPYLRRLLDRHWHWKLHGIAVNCSWHAHRLEQIIAATLAHVILDKWLFKELDHVVRALCVALQYLEKLGELFYLLLVQFDVLERRADCL